MTNPHIKNFFSNTEIVCVKSNPTQIVITELKCSGARLIFGSKNICVFCGHLEMWAIEDVLFIHSCLHS